MKRLLLFLITCMSIVSLLTARLQVHVYDTGDLFRKDENSSEWQILVVGGDSIKSHAGTANNLYSKWISLKNSNGAVTLDILSYQSFGTTNYDINIRYYASNDTIKYVKLTTVTSTPAHSHLNLQDYPEFNSPVDKIQIWIKENGAQSQVYRWRLTVLEDL